MSVLAFDSRGHIVRGRAVAWTSDDTTIAVVDSAGAVTGRNLGRTLVHAAVDGLTTAQSISVFATPATVEAADGASQHANAGTTLPQQLVVPRAQQEGTPRLRRHGAFSRRGRHGLRRADGGDERQRGPRPHALDARRSGRRAAPARHRGRRGQLDDDRRRGGSGGEQHEARGDSGARERRHRRCGGERARWRARHRCDGASSSPACP